jgi:hypothetical protein
MSERNARIAQAPLLKANVEARIDGPATVLA